jgi:hypothetical protein
MYEIIRGKPARPSFQQSSLHTSSDVAAIPHTFSTAKERELHVQKWISVQLCSWILANSGGQQSPAICLDNPI